MEESLKSLDHFQSPAEFLLSISFVRIILNARFSFAGKVPTTKLYATFFDKPIFWVRSNSFREAPQSRVLVLLIILPRDPRADPHSLFVCRMMRGQEETSTSQVGRRKGFSVSYCEHPCVFYVHGGTEVLLPSP